MEEGKLLTQFVNWMINDSEFSWEGSHSQVVDVHNIYELILHHKLDEHDEDSIQQRTLRKFIEVYESYFPPSLAEGHSKGLTIELELLTKKYGWRYIVDTVHRIDTGGV